MLIDADKAENDIVENVTTKAVSRVVAILQGQPTVKAIPIEWIKKQKVDFQNEDYPFNYCRGFQDGFNDCIDYLLSEWEEENQSLE